MADTLKHRGPDDEGFFINAKRNLEARKVATIAGEGNVGFGHRRLSIIDLSSGQQPMCNEDGSVWVTYNGEIYNYRELRSELQSRGHIFRTNSDTEMAIHAYEEWQEDCVRKFRGMFAFAIWDQNQHKLILARDRLGIKPLYYYCDDNKIIFASEIKGILADITIRRQISLEALSDYISFLYVPGPRTIFDKIYKLMPGHTLTVIGDNITIRQYWDLTFKENTKIVNEEEAQNNILETLQDSVSVRLMSEVPLGAFLSGGVDSSAVVAMMAAQRNGYALQTCSVGFSEERFNETDYARMVAERFRTEHSEYFVKPDALDVLNKLAWHYDEPFADASAVPTYYVSKLARQLLTVVLSGDGGDENFAGYQRRYFYDRLENQIRSRLPGFIRKYGCGTLGKLYPKADWLPRPLRAKTLLTNLALAPEAGYYNTMTWYDKETKNRVFNPDVAKVLQHYDSMDQFVEYFRKADTSDPLSRIQYVDMKTYLVDDILTKVDRASMANSLEVRVPLLDHHFMEYVATLPSNLKLKGRESKYIFKKALARHLPAEVLHRRKMGFSIPLSQWLREDLRTLFEDEVLQTNSHCRDYFDLRQIKKMWQRHQSGIRDYSTQLWTFLFFEKWAQNYLDNHA